MSCNFRDLHLFDNKEGAIIRAQPRNEILERTKLFHLPSLPKRESFQFSQVKAINATNCAICSKSLKSETEFCLAVQICRKCLNVYGLIDAKLNEAAERKSIELKRQRFLSKLEVK